MKMLQQGTYKHNHFSNEGMSPTKGQRNLPGDGFSHIREKMTDNFTSPRKIAKKRPIKPIVSREEPSSPNQRMVPHKNKFSSRSGIMEEKPVAPWGRTIVP